MSNILPTDHTTRALREMAIAHLRADGYNVARAKDFALQQQVYVLIKGGQTRIVALRTSTTGWLGFRRDGNTFPVLTGIDSVLHVYLRQNRQFFDLSLLPTTDVRWAVDQRMAEFRGGGREPGDIVWINAVGLKEVAAQDYFVLSATYPIPESFVGASNKPDDLDPLQAALDLPEWLWQAIQERSLRARVEPETVIRILLADHFAAATQAPLPVALGA
jgi:hypothetical protein